MKMTLTRVETETMAATDCQPTRKRIAFSTYELTDMQTHTRTDAQTQTHARTLRQSTGLTTAFECYFAMCSFDALFITHDRPDKGSCVEG